MRTYLPYAGWNHNYHAGVIRVRSDLGGNPVLSLTVCTLIVLQMLAESSLQNEPEEK